MLPEAETEARKTALQIAFYFKCLYCRYAWAVRPLADPERANLNVREIKAAQMELIQEMVEADKNSHVALAEAGHLPAEFFEGIKASIRIVPSGAARSYGDVIDCGTYRVVTVHLPSSTTPATFDDEIAKIVEEIASVVPLVIIGDMNCDARRLQSKYPIFAPDVPTCSKKRGYAFNPQLHKAGGLDDGVKDFAVMWVPPDWRSAASIGVYKVEVEVDLVRPAAQTLTLDMPSDHHAIRVRVNDSVNSRAFYFWNTFGNTLKGLEDDAAGFAEFISDGAVAARCTEFAIAWKKAPEDLSPAVAGIREELGKVVLASPGEKPVDGAPFTLLDLVDFELRRPARDASPNPCVTALVSALGGPTDGKFCRTSDFFSRPTLLFPASQEVVERAGEVPLRYFDLQHYAPRFTARLASRVDPGATPKLHLSLYGAPARPYPLAPPAFADLPLEAPAE